MKKYTLEQLKSDWCKVCVYADVCDTIDSRYCDDVFEPSNEHIEFLGKCLYGEGSKYIKS